MKPRIIGLAGPAGSGKSTVAGILTNHHGYTELQFASRIKHIVVRLLGINLRELETQKEKQIEKLGCSPRHMLQTLGTEWGRNMVHPDIWVNLLERDLRCFVPDSKIVISDCRFANEAAWLRERGELWHLARPGGDVQAHISEAGVVATDRDQVLDNDCDLDTLRQRIAALLGTDR